VTGSLGATILCGITDDGRPWAENWGALTPDEPNADETPTFCVCCPWPAPKPAQLAMFSPAEMGGWS
jgi:hypothetical protein